MKKLVFLLPIAALAMASCSNDSVVEQPTTKVVSAEALQIFPELQGITRGTVYDNGNFTTFKLTTSGSFQTGETKEDPGTTQQFSGETVTKTSGTWKIGTQDAWYWPSKSASSKFTAWAGGDAGSYTASTTIADQKDIVVAFNEGTASEFESGVPLKFRHILSQIVVKADNAAKNKIQIKVKGIRLNNIATNNTWKLPTASTVSSLPDGIWTGTPGTNDNYVINLAETTLTDGSATDLSGSDPLLLIPQQLAEATIASKSGQYLSLLVQIVDATDNTKLIYPKNNFKGETQPGNTVADPDYRSSGVDGTEKWAWTAVDINTKWEPGKKYIYTLHFTENGYGKIDGNTDGGNTNPGDDGDDSTTDPRPGDDVVDTPVKLILDVEVIDWVEVNEEQNM